MVLIIVRTMCSWNWALHCALKCIVCFFIAIVSLDCWRENRDKTQNAISMSLYFINTASSRNEFAYDISLKCSKVTFEAKSWVIQLLNHII